MDEPEEGSIEADATNVIPRISGITADLPWFAKNVPQSPFLDFSMLH